MSFWDDMEEEMQNKKKLADKLRADQPALLLTLAKFVPLDFALSIVEKSLLLEASEHNQVKLWNTNNDVSSLVSLCATLIGSEASVVDTLFKIYGPDTNFPFPSWVVSEVYRMSQLDDFESACKLVLLMTNNASTRASLSTHSDEDETDSTIAIGQLTWKKMSTVSKKLQSIDAEFDEEVPTLCPIETVLPAIRQLFHLCELELPGTIFLDEDLKVVGASLKQLRSFTFGIDGRVTEVGVQALGQLKKLTVLLFRYDYDVCKGPYANFGEALDILLAWCLGTLPWLGVLCAFIYSESYYEHVLPLMVEKVPLDLEQVQFIEFLKVSKACQTELNKKIPLLSNVQSLRIFKLHYEEKMIKTLEEVEMNKLEQLYVQEAFANPAYALFNLLGSSLTLIELKEVTGAWNFLKILDKCPVARNVSLECKRDENGFYSFDNYSQLQRVPQNLQCLKLNLKNIRGFELPSGVLARLMAAPKLMSMSINQLPLPAEDCQEAALKLKSGALRMENFTYLIYENLNGGEVNPSICSLLAAVCVFCPKLKAIFIKDPNIPRELICILAALFHSKVEMG